MVNGETPTVKKKSHSVHSQSMYYVCMYVLCMYVYLSHLRLSSELMALTGEAQRLLISRARAKRMTTTDISILQLTTHPSYIHGMNEESL